MLTLIEQAAGGMERLIESLLSYAQVGQGSLKSQQVHLDEIVESVKVTLASVIKETGGQIICTRLPVLEGDPILLKQLFQNLAGNALRYHRPGQAPVVEISAEQLGAAWQFSVKDNGQGIPLEYQDYVFEPLKRLHGSDIPGTGLGLTLCRTITARHGGRIWVESEGVGCGAIFRVSLPAAQIAKESVT